MVKLPSNTLLINNIVKLEIELIEYYESIINIIKNNKAINKLNGYFSYGLNDNYYSYSITTIYPTITLVDQYGNYIKELEFNNLDINLKIKVISKLIKEYNLFIK